MPTLLYFADPMCSWCWGFAPVMQRVQAELPYPVEVIMGGLRATETRGITPELRDYVQHHWQQVHSTTGQPFRFDGALPDGFVYNTEAACRAVVTVRALVDQGAALLYLHDLQRAFYVEAQEITRPEVLARLATPYLDGGVFLDHFNEPAIQEATVTDFERKDQCGVMGFPCLIADTGERLRMICMGYQPFDVVVQQLSRRLGNLAGAGPASRG